MDWKIVLPENIITHVIKWLHQVFGHPGNNRMRDAIQTRYCHPNLRSHIDNVECKTCQMHQPSGKGSGFLPERDIHIYPWQKLSVDLIGPWVIQLYDKL